MTNTSIYVHRESLVRQFTELKSMEDASAALYQSLVPDITDPEDRRTMELIIADEYKHSKMAQNIIDIIQSA